MTINVKFVGAFRHFSGFGKIELSSKDLDSVYELINALIKKLPEIQSNLIDRHLENSSPNALILVNEREIGLLDGLETKLKDGDDVVIIPVMHGG